MDKSDEIIKFIAEQVRAVGGDVHHPCRIPHYIVYLEEKLCDNGLLTEDLQYLLELYYRLQSRDYFSDGRPSTSPTTVNELEDFLNGNYDNSVASIVGKVFILHQISEERFYRLIKAVQFLIELAMGGDRISQTDMEDQNLINLCKTLEMYINFPSRNELIQEARQINSMRNQVAHKLLRTDSVEQLEKLAKVYLTRFSRLENLIEKSFDEIDERIKIFRKFSNMFENNVVARLTLRLDDNEIAYQDEDAFATELGLVF